MILVTYDLRKPDRDYSSLYEKLESAKTWARVAESVWLLGNEIDCALWRDNLKKVMDSDDLLFVIEVKHHWASTNLKEDVVAWLKNDNNW